MRRREFVKNVLLGVPVAASLGGCKKVRTCAKPATHGLREKAKLAMLATQRQPWEQGVVMMALLELDDQVLIVPMASEAVLRMDKEGRLAVVSSATTITDPASNGSGVLRAYELTGDNKYKQAADAQYNFLKHKAPRTDNGTLYHFTDSQQVWSDSMYMAPPFLARYGDCEEAVKQLRGFMGYLWDKEKHMMSHMWDDKNKNFRRKAFWGGGNGWSAAGMALVLELLPETMNSERQELITRTQELLDGCIKHMRTDGLFHDVVDDPSTFVESNLGQMLAFTIYKGVKAEWLDQSYLAHANLMRASAHTKVDEYGVIHDACGSPSFDKPGTSAEAQAFLVMMESAYARL